MTAPRRFEFYYDFVCPYAFLASRRVTALGDVNGGVELRPVLLGGIFRAIGGPDDPNLVKAAPKRAYGVTDLRRAAARQGVALRPPEGHPRRTVLALRAAIASGDLGRATPALFAAYWLEGRDLEAPAAVAEVLDRVGLDGAAAVERAGSAAIKDDLRARTDQAVAHGLFGVPTFRVVETGELVFGEDRLDVLAAKLRAGTALPFYFDYASPYAYLGAMSLPSLVARTGVRVDYRPLVLGGLFKSLGTPNVPLFEMPAAKQRYLGDELTASASRLGVPFRFTTHFPMNTVKALRLTLAAPEAARPALVDALFRALWVEDRDLSSLEVLTEIAESCAAREALARIDAPEIKTGLFDATAAAERAGVFGVPSFIVGGELYWGQDRMADVERALLHGPLAG